MLLVFFLLFSILQRSLPSQGESQIGAIWLPVRRSFRLFLILGRRNLRRFSFWHHQMTLQSIIPRLSPYPNSVFPSRLLFCLGPNAASLKNWILGTFRSLFFLCPWKTRVLLLSLILTTGSQPPFEKLLCLSVADKYLNFLVVKLHVLCTHSKLVQMERHYGFSLVSKAIHEFQVLIWLPGRVSFSFL